MIGPRATCPTAAERPRHGQPASSPVRRWDDYLTLSVTEIREYGGASIQVVRRLRAMLEELSEAVLPERREAVLHELARLDAAVAEKWDGTVDLDLARLPDRQGIGGPSARGDAG